MEWKGKKHYFGPFDHPDSHAKYRRFLQEHVLIDAAPSRPLRSEIAESLGVLCLGALCLSYLRYSRNRLKHKNAIANVKAVCNEITKHWGDIPAADFGPSRLKEFRRHQIARGFSRRYINGQVFKIRRMFKWAVSEEMLPASVLAGLEAVHSLREGEEGAKELPPIRPIEESIVAKTIAAAPRIVGDMIRLQQFSSVRPGEIVSLSPDKIDRDRPDGIWLYLPPSHKTRHHGKGRIIFFGPKCQAILAPYLDRPADAPCFSPREAMEEYRAAKSAERKTPLNQGNKRGTKSTASPKKSPGAHYTTHSYNRAIRTACEIAFDMPKHLRIISPKLNEAEAEEAKRQAREWRRANCWAPNRLRHAAATEIRKRFGLEAAQIALGHSRADTTQIYAERDLSLGVKIAKEMG